MICDSQENKNLAFVSNLIVTSVIVPAHFRLHKTSMVFMIYVVNLQFSSWSAAVWCTVKYRAPLPLLLLIFRDNSTKMSSGPLIDQGRNSKRWLIKVKKTVQSAPFKKKKRSFTNTALAIQFTKCALGTRFRMVVLAFALIAAKAGKRFLGIQSKNEVQTLCHRIVRDMGDNGTDVC